MKQSTNFSVVNLSQQDIPIVIEDIKTLDRDWVMDYEIFPINDIHYYGNWEHTEHNVKTHLQNVI